jgi:hypothetical protein
LALGRFALGRFALGRFALGRFAALKGRRTGWSQG